MRTWPVWQYLEIADLYGMARPFEQIPERTRRCDDTNAAPARMSDGESLAARVSVAPRGNDGRNEPGALSNRIRTLRLDPLFLAWADEETLLAVALGVSKLKVRAVRRAFEREVASIACVLLAEPRVATQIGSLSLRDGDTVVGLGDEMTSDRLSWFEVLAVLYSLQHAGRQVRFVNMAAPGQTTSQMLDRMDRIRAIRPRIVLCMPGVHDARRSGGRNAPTMVSLRETDRNLFQMRLTVRASRWMWIVPPVQRATAIGYYGMSANGRYRWVESDCRAIRALIRAQDEQVVEPLVFATPRRGLLGSEDGDDPLAVGRSQILRAVLEGLESTR